jgi:hypothetical protein
MQDSLISDLVAALSEKLSTDRSSFIACIKSQLGRSLQKTIDNHNTSSVIFVLDNQGQQLLLKAELGKNTATHKEAGWYEHLTRIGLGGDTLYLGSAQTGKFALVVLRYIDGAITLDEWAVKYPTKHSEFSAFMLSMFKYDETLFSKTATVVPKDAIEQFLLTKHGTRRKEAAEIQYLDNLFTEQRITVNGQRYHTPDHALRRILNDRAVREELLPDFIGVIHGDLHTGNALIKNKSLYYIDPNGNLEMPLEYDLAKMLHSVHGQYPVIMRGAFTLSGGIEKGYDLNLKKESIYFAAHQELKGVLDRKQYLRSVFIEALHFATMLPHHAQKQVETTALFLRSIQLFGELFLLLG